MKSIVTTISIILLIVGIHTDSLAIKPLQYQTNEQMEIQEDTKSFKVFSSKIFQRFKTKIKKVKNWMWGTLIGSLLCTGILLAVGNSTSTSLLVVLTFISSGILSLLLFLAFIILLIVFLTLLGEKGSEKT